LGWGETQGKILKPKEYSYEARSMAPSNSGGGNQEDWFEASLGKKLGSPYLNQQVGHGGVYLQSYLLGGIGRRIMVPG
jgi:hypothetical protein